MKTWRLALVGQPVQHSWSPALHDAALAHAGLSGTYVLRDTPEADLEEVFRELRDGRLDGINVTVPHKVIATACVDALTPTAALLGAINTVVREGDRLVGDNTDVPGFSACLEGPLPASAVVLGAGGAARSAVVALARAGLERVTVVARTPDRIRSWLDEQAAPYLHPTRLAWRPWADLDEVLPDAGWLVQATTVGMHPNGSDSPLTDSQIACLPDAGVVHDLVYRPDPTRLVELARARGLEAHSGGRMLAFQAREAFRAWTGLEVPGSVWLEALRIQACRVI